MAVTSGFFNSINHDRKYDAVQMSSMFDGIICDGVLSGYGDHLLVIPNTGMTVSVSEGKAWFNHTWTLNNSSKDIQLSLSDPLKKRIDLIYLEINNDTRYNDIYLKEGELFSTTDKEIKPTIENTSTVFRYPLAYITVDAGVTEINESMIENMIGTDSCPFSTALMEQVTADKLYNQWAAQFRAWWDDLRIIMTDDVAGKLQAEIDELNRWVAAVTIPQGSNKIVIENAYIDEDSILDVYYSSATVEEASKRNPTYIQEKGSLTIIFSDALSKDVLIDGIHVTKVKYPS